MKNTTTQPTTINNQNVLTYFTKLKNDVYGNPRYKISASDLSELACIDYNQSETAYNNLVKAIRKLGGGKLNTRNHPYSIKVTSYNIVRTALHLIEKLKG
jgi:hypothetical protein|tara:strand:- start:298 stop:597 length:300 start_codon:yes stop_codon:yes gene_type:complete